MVAHNEKGCECVFSKILSVFRKSRIGAVLANGSVLACLVFADRVHIVHGLSAQFGGYSHVAVQSAYILTH